MRSARRATSVHATATIAPADAHRTACTAPERRAIVAATLPMPGRASMSATAATITASAAANARPASWSSPNIAGIDAGTTNATPANAHPNGEAPAIADAAAAHTHAPPKIDTRRILIGWDNEPGTANGSPERTQAALRACCYPAKIMAFGPRTLVYRVYQRRLAGTIRNGPLPRHVGVILDGNRRWAKATGYEDAAEGHRRGAAKIDELLGWCSEFGIPVVTLWLLSTENLQSRDPAELEALLGIIEDKVRDLASDEHWRIHGLGNIEVLPESTVRVLQEAEHSTEAHAGRELNIAVGYGGRQEIADAIRQMLVEYDEKGLDLTDAAAKVSTEEIARFLYTAGLPDPDLIIRTSGEVRLSGFLLWQSAHSEFFFCDPYWPDFRKIDFLRALRDYQQRHRRFGR